MEPPDGGPPGRAEGKTIPLAETNLLPSTSGGSALYANIVNTIQRQAEIEDAILARKSTHNGIPALIFKAKDYYGTMATPCRKTLVGRFLKARPQIERIRSKFSEKFPLKESVKIGVYDNFNVFMDFTSEEDFNTVWFRRVIEINGQQMWLQKGSPDFKQEEDLPFAPVWVLLHRLPYHMHFWAYIKQIVGEIGTPLELDAATKNRTRPSMAKVEGPRSPEELLTVLQRVIEESAPVLVTARVEAEERRTNMRLREEQDAAYRAALEADQARERQRKEEQERLEREAAEAERKKKEEEEARERAAHEAAEREAALAKMRQEKLLSLGPEPEKGPDVTQVLVRFPTGERKERRFHCTTTIQSLYDYVDSLGCLEVDNYSLVSNFPRTVYGSEKHSLSLKDAGLHPQASLFIELSS